MWNEILTAEELKAHFDRISKLDAAFAAESRKFYESRTKAQLSTLAFQAWNCNDAEGYMLARSFGAL